MEEQYNNHTSPSIQFLMIPGSGSWWLKQQQFNVSFYGDFDIEINSVEFSSSVSNTPSVLSLRSNYLQSPYTQLLGYSFAVNPSTPQSGEYKNYKVNGVKINGIIDFQLYDNTAGNYTSSLIQGMQYCLVTLTVTPSKFKHSRSNVIV